MSTQAPKTSTTVPRVVMLGGGATWSDSTPRARPRFTYGDDRIAPEALRMDDDATLAHRERYIEIGLIKPAPANARTLVRANGDHDTDHRTRLYGAGKTSSHGLNPLGAMQRLWDLDELAAGTPLDRHERDNAEFLAAVTIRPGRSVLARVL